MRNADCETGMQKILTKQRKSPKSVSNERHSIPMSAFLHFRNPHSQPPPLLFHSLVFLNLVLRPQGQLRSRINRPTFRTYVLSISRPTSTPSNQPFLTSNTVL